MSGRQPKKPGPAKRTSADSKRPNVSIDARSVQSSSTNNLNIHIKKFDADDVIRMSEKIEGFGQAYVDRLRIDGENEKARVAQQGVRENKKFWLSIATVLCTTLVVLAVISAAVALAVLVSVMAMVVLIVLMMIVIPVVYFVVVPSLPKSAQSEAAGVAKAAIDGPINHLARQATSTSAQKLLRGELSDPYRPQAAEDAATPGTAPAPTPADQPDH
jgi:hypothetical protein